MAFAFRTKLKNLSTKCKSKANGWIREAERELSLPATPTMIRVLVAVYLQHNEYFTMTAVGIEMDGDKKKIKIFDKKENMNFGSQKIELFDKKDSTIYEWKFQIPMLKDFTIGICGRTMESVTLNPNQSPSKNNVIIAALKNSVRSSFWKFCMRRDEDGKPQWISWTKKDKRSDSRTLRMTLKGELISFVIEDGTTHGLMLHEGRYVQEATYNMFVSLGQNAQIKLLSFDIYDHWYACFIFHFINKKPQKNKNN